MFLIHCPHCGETRAEEEFHAEGPAHLARPEDPRGCSDGEWGDYLYFRDNPRGWHRELWVHAAGCRRRFVVLRHTESYRIAGSYPLDGWLEAPAGAPADGSVGRAAEPSAATRAPGAASAAEAER